MNDVWITGAMVLSCVVLLGSLAGCMTPLEGPPQDLVTLTTPDPTPPVPPLAPVPQPAPGPQPPSGYFRAWMPRQTTATGDTTDGHWALISTTPPPVEVVPPRLPIPRPPVTKPDRPKPTVQLPLSKVPPEFLPPGMTPTTTGQEVPPSMPQGLPPGMGWSDPGMRGAR